MKEKAAEITNKLDANVYRRSKDRDKGLGQTGELVGWGPWDDCRRERLFWCLLSDCREGLLWCLPSDCGGDIILGSRRDWFIVRFISAYELGSLVLELVPQLTKSHAFEAESMASQALCCR